MRRPGEALSRVQLLDAAWDIAFESHSNVVDVYVRYLREKIDRPFGRHSLETVRGVGYRLRDTLSEPPADPDPADAAVRARDGGRARRARRVRLPPGRLDAPALRPTRPCSRRRPRRRSGSTGAAAARPRLRQRRELRAGARRAAARSSLSDPAGLPPLLDREPGAAASPAAARCARRSSIPGRTGRWRLLAIPRLGRQAQRARARDARSTRAASRSSELRQRAARRARRSRCCSRRSAGYLLAGAALRPVEAMRRKAGAISAATPGSRLPVPPRARRGLAARRDAERHARAARDRLRARAALRRRREPRAAHAARAAPDRARARASPSALARRARGRAALGRRGDRPADRARRRPAR